MRALSTVVASLAALALVPASLANAQGSAPSRWSALRLSGANPSGAPRPASDTVEEEALVERAYALRAPGLSAHERAGLRETLAEGYAELRADYPEPLPSVFAASFLSSHEAEGGFDALVAEPPGPARVGVVFLHGFGGNTTLSCDLVARAAAEAGAITVCPTVGGGGRWASARGLAIVRVAIAHLRGRGVTRVALAGLSNGANGVSAHARALTPELSGLVLLSGAARGRTRLPAFVAHGSADRMIDDGGSRAFARRSPHATWVPLSGNHFAALAERATLRPRLRDWVGALDRVAALAP